MMVPSNNFGAFWTARDAAPIGSLYLPGLPVVSAVGGLIGLIEVLSDPLRRKQYDDSLPEDISDPVPLPINVQYSRSSLQQFNEPQLIYVLLILETQAMSDAHSGPPLNLCLALDCSTSMRGRCLETVKSTALELIHQMRPQDQLSLVTFNDRADVRIPAGSRYDPSRIDNIIRSLQASGGTEIFKGLEAGYNQVFRQMRGDSINHIVLLTDGRTYGDEEHEHRENSCGFATRLQIAWV